MHPASVRLPQPRRIGRGDLLHLCSVLLKPDGAAGPIPLFGSAIAVIGERVPPSAPREKRGRRSPFPSGSLSPATFKVEKAHVEPSLHEYGESSLRLSAGCH